MTPGRIAQVACLLEASARKVGNVHRFQDFEDCSYLDFLLSAQAIGPALDRAAESGVGAAVWEAIEVTRRVVATNTNLGMVLLLAPMAAADEKGPLREGVEQVLAATTTEDARLVYQAIRLANPGGLGTVAEQDVSRAPTVTLTAAMTLAASRDLVARQYANGFAEVFEIAAPALEASLAEGRSVETAIVTAHLQLLSRVPDTLIARKCGADVAAEVMSRAPDVFASGWPDGTAGLRAFDAFDRWLRDDAHARNPGATADLTAAALFAALRSGTIALPMSGWETRPH